MQVKEPAFGAGGRIHSDRAFVLAASASSGARLVDPGQFGRLPKAHLQLHRRPMPSIPPSVRIEDPAMTFPTRWNPFRQLSRFEPFGDIDELMRGFAPVGLSREYQRAMEMRLDVNEDEQQYVVNIDMPGVKKTDIDIAVDGNQITVSAEVNREESRGKGKELYSERYSGKAFRTFALPVEVDSEKAEATYDGGVLTLTLPKKPGNGSHRLTVN
jgi:HSP20 family protein